MRNSEGSKEAEGSKLKAQRRDSPQGDSKNSDRKVHRAGSMGQREAEVGKRGRWDSEKLKAGSSMRNANEVGG
jgi:hypothetical protein